MYILLFSLLLLFQFDLNYVGFKFLEKDVIPLMEKLFDLNYVGFKWRAFSKTVRARIV